LSYYLTFLLVASLLYARDKPEATTNVPQSHLRARRARLTAPPLVLPTGNAKKKRSIV